MKNIVDTIRRVIVFPNKMIKSIDQITLGIIKIYWLTFLDKAKSNIDIVEKATLVICKINEIIYANFTTLL